MVSSKVRHGIASSCGNKAWEAAWLKAPGSPWKAIRLDILFNPVFGGTSALLVAPCTGGDPHLRRGVAARGPIEPRRRTSQPSRESRGKRTVWDNPSEGRKAGCEKAPLMTMFRARGALT